MFKTVSEETFNKIRTMVSPDAHWGLQEQLFAERFDNPGGAVMDEESRRFVTKSYFDDLSVPGLLDVIKEKILDTDDPGLIQKLEGAFGIGAQAKMHAFFRLDRSMVRTPFALGYEEIDSLKKSARALAKVNAAESMKLSALFELETAVKDEAFFKIDERVPQILRGAADVLTHMDILFRVVHDDLKEAGAMEKAKIPMPVNCDPTGKKHEAYGTLPPKKPEEAHRDYMKCMGDMSKMFWESISDIAKLAGDIEQEFKQNKDYETSLAQRRAQAMELHAA